MNRFEEKVTCMGWEAIQKVGTGLTETMGGGNLLFYIIFYQLKLKF